MKKVLFILKRRENYGEYSNGCDIDHYRYGDGLITGLLVSVRLIVEMLIKHGVDAKLVVVHDNNDIDREVTKFKPQVVIIEALWVVPEKFKILVKLHPKVKWIIRLHSAVPFIANEGIAMKWIFEYVKYPTVSVSTNDARLFRELQILFGAKYSWNESELEHKLLYQPNYYPYEYRDKNLDRDKEILDIGCFGAIRPMKNQLIQAVAAIIFADSLGKKLHFHISGGRLEMKGDPVLHNLIDLFKHFEHRGHKLIIHDWMHHHHFKRLIGKMDLNMQVSYSETFNIVAADSVTMGVPLVASDEIFWSAPYFWANPNSTDSILTKLQYAYDCPDFNVSINVGLLKRFDESSEKTWLHQIKKL
jgi:hypothetical protein